MTLGLFIRDAAGVSREVSELVIRDGTNTQRTISELWVRDDTNTPRLVYNPSGSATLTVDISPPGGTGFSFGSGVATTDVPCVATATGGTAPYTYAWNLISYTSLAAPPTADSPASASSTFTQTGIDPNTTVSAVWTCTATDDNANTADSAEITTYFSDIS